MHTHTHSIHHFPLNHFFHCFLASAAHTHHWPVVQLYPSLHSSTFVLSSPSAAQSAVIYVTTSHRPVRRPDMWHYRQLLSMNTVMWVFFPDTKTLLFPFQSSSSQVSTSCVPTTEHMFGNSNMGNLSQLTADMINTLVPKRTGILYAMYYIYMFYDLYAFLYIILTHMW